ncbi:FecR family protein [Cyclobacterium qasimii]|uniref:Iron dicitrate transporter FecR n=2 Tax=Cyclobacterium qasimii TaxID=1350429 RepID=A0A512C9K0_9BACT|nr:FecR family protein [Cyclobacterium qasimii]EPR67621.1 putative anti-sigma factor [Cyclobacterium qasimii M12-11B]GEO20892.1 iron dicitrate transporter FecR [Cyclobacterium qasimii]
MDEKKDMNLRLLRYLAGKANQTEKNEVMDWVKENPLHQYQFDQLKKYWEGRTKDPQLISHAFQKDKIWKQYQDSQGTATVKNKPKPIARPFYWVRVAAAILLLLAATIVYLQRENLFPPEEIENAYTYIAIEKYNPIGQKSQTQLPDGSKVWLNADSKITFPETFPDSVRIVHLEGEAFFDVLHDSLRPFKVIAENVQVKVLGTKFNVNAYKGQQEINIALLEGSINVSDEQNENAVLVQPDHGVSYSKQLQIFREFSREDHRAMFDKAISWKNGKLIFDSNNLEDFVTEISRWYGVSVEIKGVPQNDWNLVGTFENEYLTNVLDAISYNKEFKYELKEKKLTLIFN